MKHIESLNLLMLNVGFARHNGDWNWKNISSPFTRIYLVTEGEAKLHLPTGVIGLKPGHLYILPQNTLHSYECQGAFCHYYLHIYERFKQETDIFDYYDFPSEIKAEEGDEDIFKRMCKLHPEAALPASDPSSYDNRTTFMDDVSRYNSMELYQRMLLRGMILILFSHFMQHATKRLWTEDERMTSVLGYIHKHLYDEIDIEALSSKACMTSAYLIRLFRKHLGTTPLQYINQKKIERAQLLLITENMSVKELAYTLGFNDHSYFIRLFRKTTGTTPLEYRNRMR